MSKYFPDTTRHAKAQEFLELKQGVMTAMDYVASFTELARFSDDYMAVVAPLSQPDPLGRIRTESGMPQKSLHHSKSYLCGSEYKNWASP